MHPVPGEGFEPPAFGLQNRCTTAVLTRLSTDNKSLFGDPFNWADVASGGMPRFQPGAICAIAPFPKPAMLELWMEAGHWLFAFRSPRILSACHEMRREPLFSAFPIRRRVWAANERRKVSWFFQERRTSLPRLS
jgi:hypothetical protein